MDEPVERSIVLIVRTGRDGVQRATIVTPKWNELPEGWDAPHADSYSKALSYQAIAIDI